jgi:hypothetical protein
VSLFRLQRGVGLMTAKFIESIGLLLDIAGVIVLAWGLMIDRKTGASDVPKNGFDRFSDHAAAG